jgi:outer membrane protein OmpA-like peptidoglycan-associated protein
MKKHIFIAIIFTLLISNSWAQSDKTKLKVKKLPDVINTNHEELCPVISGDGKTLYFVRVNFKDTLVRGKKIEIFDKQKIWVSTRTADSSDDWSKADSLLSPVNNGQHNVVCGTNYDGTVLFLSNAYEREKVNNRFEGMKPGISVSFQSKQTKEWSIPKTIPLDFGVQKLHPTGHFYYHVVDGGKHLFVSLHDGKKKNSHHGEEDIYYFTLLSDSTFSEEYQKLFTEEIKNLSEEEFKGLVEKYTSHLKYGNPINLGNVINSQTYETAPFLSKDGLKLYFTRHDETAHEDNNYKGNSHIYVAERTSTEDWAAWKQPIEVYNQFKLYKGEDADEEGLNSKNFDAYLVLHDRKDKKEGFDYGFFSSARTSSTKDKSKDFARADIYEFDIVEPEPIDLIVRVFDKNTSKPLNAKVDLKTPKQAKIEKNESKNTWEYQFTDEDYGKYEAFASTAGYKSASSTLDVNSKKTVDSLYLEPEMIFTGGGGDTTEQGLFYEGILFAFDKPNRLTKPSISDIDKTEQSKLDSLVKIMQQDSAYKVILGGYTDYIGLYERNLELSKRRVDAVKFYLMSKRIDTSRVFAIYNSEDFHFVPTDTTINAKATLDANLELRKDLTNKLDSVTTDFGLKIDETAHKSDVLDEKGTDDLSRALSRRVVVEAIATDITKENYQDKDRQRNRDHTKHKVFFERNKQK